MSNCLKIIKSECMLIMHFSAVGMCFDFLLKTITPNLLQFYFYSLKQWWFSSVNQDNMDIESGVIGPMTYSYIKIYIKIICWYATYRLIIIFSSI